MKTVQNKSTVTLSKAEKNEIAINVTGKIAIYGQEKASNLASGLIAQFLSDKGAENAAVVHGPAGVGKSFMNEAIIEACKAEKIRIIHIGTGAELARADSEGMTNIVSALRDSADGMKTLILIDESHNAPIKPMAASLSPSARVLTSLTFGAGQGWKRYGSVEFLGETINFNTANILFILSTNHPERIGGGKNPDAIKRRFLSIELSKYTDEQMRKLIPQYCVRKGYEVRAEAIPAILRLHRGTFAPLDALSQVLAGDFALQGTEGKRIVTKETLINALPLCEYTLRGYTWPEIKAMQWIAATSEPTKSANVQQKFPMLDIGELYRHGSAQRTKIKGEETTELTPHVFRNAKNELKITEYGIAFLRSNSALFSTRD